MCANKDNNNPMISHQAAETLENSVKLLQAWRVLISESGDQSLGYEDGLILTLDIVSHTLNHLIAENQNV